MLPEEMPGVPEGSQGLLPGSGWPELLGTLAHYGHDVLIPPLPFPRPAPSPLFLISADGPAPVLSKKKPSLGLIQTTSPSPTPTSIHQRLPAVRAFSPVGHVHSLRSASDP